jgi:hypothetical protein
MMGFKYYFFPSFFTIQIKLIYSIKEGSFNNLQSFNFVEKTLREHGF